EQAEKSGDSLDFDLVEALDSLESWMTIATIKPRRKSRIHEKRYEMLAATIDGVDYPQGAPRPVADLEAAQTHIDAERRYTYTGIPWWRRVVVLLGGSVFNLLFAIIVITSVLMIVGTAHPSTTIGTIIEGSPAAQAGLVPGDVLKSVNGVECETWGDFTQAVAAYKVGETVRLGYTHEGIERLALITLADNEGRPLVGVTTKFERGPFPFPDALRVSVGLIGQVVQIIFQLLNPATFSETVSQSSSIVGIAVEAERAASSGLLSFITLSALLSISIGLMNLLPVPPLDGGKIIVETIQRVTKRIVPPRVINTISIVALLLLGLLFIVVTNQDIHRYFLGG
ncbi:MAG: M50 family metallopeptidase, partial [Coriobacteriia bacterium]|nr:M50 family metallopeptidase [Coriobacteriia bacterium]